MKENLKRQLPETNNSDSSSEKLKTKHPKTTDELSISDNLSIDEGGTHPELIFNDCEIIINPQVSLSNEIKHQIKKEEILKLCEQIFSHELIPITLFN